MTESKLGTRLQDQRPLHILIIEDVSVDVDLTLLELESAGIAVTYDAVATALDCQKQLQNCSYDMVLSDYRLPSFKGLQAFNYLRESGQDIPFILITGSLGEEAAVECIKAGMTDYILKDRLFRLPSVLERALQEFSVRRQQKAAIAQIEQQAWRDAIINRIVQSMRETLVLEDVLQTTADLLRESLQVSRCLIFQKSKDRQFRVKYFSQSNECALDVDGASCLFFSCFQENLQAGSQVTFHQIDENINPQVYQVAQDHGIRSIIISPLIYRNNYLGGISLHQCDREREWSDNELTLVKAIAYQCAIAIHHSELYQSAQNELMERKKMEAQLRHDAFHDTLTGLPNRALFLDRLSHALQLSHRWTHLFHASNPYENPEQFAVLFLDLDRFKTINDSLGHLAGDQLLKFVATRLVDCLRAGDTVARLGGDEFVMLIERITDINDVIEVAQRIQDSLKVPVLLDSHEIFVSTSIGIALNSPEYSQPDQLLRDADSAMYRAKEHGRNRYEVFNPTMHQEALEKLRLENDLRRAIDRHEFTLHYQPIVCLQSRQILGFEALIRWQHPEKGLIYPVDFVPFAEDVGMIVAIDQWVMQESCAQLKAWQDQYSLAQVLVMNVNLSARQFNQPNLTSQIKDILEKANLNSTNLKIEITERTLIEKTSIATQILGELSDLQIQTCIDDFGTGYSSLSYLHRFPIHTVKIDRSFVTRLNDADESSDREIIKAIIALGLNLGLNVIAEGVETEQQLEFLKVNNCHAGQGYYLGEPQTTEAIASLLTNLSTKSEKP
ncbi:MAG: two-component system response regulator [Oscillatoriales cyanobacterium CG2_30_44_21]|nr:MAG: two-component system response regulator [Oscillatoriales cyanobacterium CG2_30_44_21]